MKTIKILLKGRVQGVNFRHSVQNFAKSLRLNGYAKNLKDGSVEIVAQGEEKSIFELLTWCQKGNTFAKIKGMSFEWVEITETYKDFKVVLYGSFLKDKAKGLLSLSREIKDEITGLNKNYTIPEHIVIIPNGNRTWSRAKSLKPWEGYWHVLKKLESLMDAGKDLDLKHLTFWGFSTENWKRNSDEVQQLLKVFEKAIDKFQDKFLTEGIRFKHLGRKDRLPENLVEKLLKTEQLTKDFQKRSINVAFDYGGRDEILRAIDTIIKTGKQNITEEEFSSLLDTAGIPDPDLIIRTAGENRLSGMMPWQSVYSEIYSTNVFFPDFGVEHLKEAIADYNLRKRTFGGDVDLNAQADTTELADAKLNTLTH